MPMQKALYISLFPIVQNANNRKENAMKKKMKRRGGWGAGSGGGGSGVGGVKGERQGNRAKNDGSVVWGGRNKTPRGRIYTSSSLSNT